MIFTAYAILLGHNIIPHHHHTNEHDLAEHHQTHHNHDGDEESRDLGHLFSHFIHSTDGFIFTGAHSIAFSKLQLLFVALLPDNFSLNEFLIPPLLHKQPAEHLVYISPYSHLSGLRAPPAKFI